MRKFEPVKNAPVDTILPVRGTEQSAGYDFYAPCDIFVPAHGCSKLVFFNVKAKMPSNEYLKQYIRSSLAVKHDVDLLTSGVIDADYYGNEETDGNIAARFINHGAQDYIIRKGERCMQGIFMEYKTVSNDKTLGKRKGGYGSTGKE